MVLVGLGMNENVEGLPVWTQCGLKVDSVWTLLYLNSVSGLIYISTLVCIPETVCVCVCVCACQEVLQQGKQY